MTRRTDAISFTDDDRGLAIICTVAFDLRRATRDTRDEPGEDAAVEGIAVCSVDQVEIMCGGLQLPVDLQIRDSRELTQWVLDNYLSEIESEIRREHELPEVFN